jgi:glutathione synthase/RimK-type ligase-like ATP-grasp enzyme
MKLKTGIFSSNEIYAEALIDVINEKSDVIRAEFIVLSPPYIDEICHYKVIVDRISHMVKFIRSYLKHASLTGTYIINNPFLFSYDDKFYGITQAKNLGISIPRTVLLPCKIPAHDLLPGDLHNLSYPVDWQGLCDYTGFPAILKPVDGHGWQNIYKVNNIDELLYYYNLTGDILMILQEFIDFEDYIRVFVIGKKHVLPVRYDPLKRNYVVQPEPVRGELRDKITEDSININKALGYDMNTVEFAIKDGIPYAIDFMNPVPDCNPSSIKEEHFTWVVDKMADFIIEYIESVS